MKMKYRSKSLPRRVVWQRSDRVGTPRPAPGLPKAVVASRAESVPRPPPPQALLVPLDGTPVAEHALPQALALARRSGAELRLAHVYSTLQAADRPELLGWHGGRQRVEPGRDYLEALADRLAGAHGVRVRPLLLRGYWPEDAICASGDWDADLVVMAARPRRWWSRLWRGSVSAEVARRSRTPVLLVPAREGAPDLSREPALGRVLVPLDGSASAEQALGPAVALAALSKGSCELLHVARVWPYSVDWSLAYGAPPAPTPTSQPDEGERYLRAVASRMRALPVPVRWQVVSDERPLADAVARHAELCGADIIALSSRGGVGLGGLLRGSVAVRVARRSGLPVLVCRAA
jgi:nucleotide-binding universal stress UspA family protein